MCHWKFTDITLTSRTLRNNRGRNLLILNLTGLNPGLDLVPVPLKLLYLLLQVRLKFLLLIGIVGIINLESRQRRKSKAQLQNYTPSSHSRRRVSGRWKQTLFQMLSKTSTPSWTFLRTRSISPWSFRLAPIADSEMWISGNELSKNTKLEDWYGRA